MIDLNEVVERFLDEALWQCRNEGGKEDETVLRFLNDPNNDLDLRRTEVRNWLRYYGVLQGLNAADRDAVSGVVIEFADARGPFVPPLSEGEIVGKFADLHSKCCARVHQNKDDTPRDLTSLTSKALWCCYPDAIPIFDSYAQRALRVISHLLSLDRSRVDAIEYARFVSVWLNLYRRVEPTLNDARLGNYPYKVRVFDRILWIIGEPDYGVNMRRAASAR
jgi:hypothetical protein